MNKNQTSWLAFSLLALGQATWAVGTASAGDYDVQDTTGGGKEVNTSLGEGNFGRQKFTITSDTRFGYDDNTLGTPDQITVPVTNAAGQQVVNAKGFAETRNVGVNKSSSAFFNFDVGVGYTAANPRLTATIGADVGVSYYFDRPGRSYDINGGLSGRLTYKLTPRAFLEVNTYNAYESEGDYGASNISGFTGQFGTNGQIPGTSAARNGDYFYTTDGLSLTYQLSPRFSAVFGQNLVAFAYDSSPYSTDQDRIESYTSAELEYLLQPNLTLTGTYRFGYIDYFSVSNDSQTHFLLGGANYSFNQRLKATFSAGVEFREYFDAIGDETSPYGEGVVTYDISRNSHLSLNARYGIEEGVLFVGNSKADTVRAGIDYTQNFTARISGYVSFYYTHAAYQTLTEANNSVPDFNEDTYDVAVGARYAINRHFAAEIGYTHTSFDSQLADRSYERNRYFGGLRVAF